MAKYLIINTYTEEIRHTNSFADGELDKLSEHLDYVVIDIEDNTILYNGIWKPIKVWEGIEDD